MMRSRWFHTSTGSLGVSAPVRPIWATLHRPDPQSLSRRIKVCHGCRFDFADLMIMGGQVAQVSRRALPRLGLRLGAASAVAHGLRFSSTAVARGDIAQPCTCCNARVARCSDRGASARVGCGLLFVEVEQRVTTASRRSLSFERLFHAGQRSRPWAVKA